MNRRTVLVLGGSALTTALAGCLGDDSDIDFDDPEAVTEAFLLSIVEPDYDTMEALVHEGIERETHLDLSAEDRRDWASVMERYERVVRETEIAKETSDSVVVEAKLTDQTLNEPVKGTVSYELRTEDGDWKIYDTVDVDIGGLDGAM